MLSSTPAHQTELLAKSAMCTTSDPMHERREQWTRYSLYSAFYIPLIVTSIAPLPPLPLPPCFQKSCNIPSIPNITMAHGASCAPNGVSLPGPNGASVSVETNVETSRMFLQLHCSLNATQLASLQLSSPELLSIFCELLVTMLHVQRPTYVPCETNDVQCDVHDREGGGRVSKGKEGRDKDAQKAQTMKHALLAPNDFPRLLNVLKSYVTSCNWLAHSLLTSLLKGNSFLGERGKIPPTPKNGKNYCRQ